MNTVHISGNIGVEPEFKLFDSGKRKVCFSVALKQYGTNKQGDTIWIPCQAWDTIYDRLLKCQQKSKLSGRRINITGSLAQTKWMDETTGKHHTKLILKIQSFELIGSSQQESVPPELRESPTQSQTAAEIIFDGKPMEFRRRLPFPFKSNELRSAKEDSSS